ncbi:hypothetical protein [Desulfosporosinus nitroreducens]|uniref:hypothetical protein n=1 Tax=Desulfosporosinus nitroreducens TaxID=2018668 RepID=UPI00207D15F7|nr:hypothetical protein [Desulfosporosinus nitroreducens]MCO1602026.1 hypothetical protein [Desulfosporosinus nitroreducens]
MKKIRLLFIIISIVGLIGILNYVPQPDKIIITHNGITKEITKTDNTYSLILEVVRKSIYFNTFNLEKLKCAAPSEPNKIDGIEFFYNRPIVLGSNILINKFFIDDHSVLFVYKNGQYIYGGQKLKYKTNLYDEIIQYLS